MLERFKKINKVGLFNDYAHTTGCELGDVTLIYGENGVGKSTLAAILDSLRDNNGAELIRRRSLPGDMQPNVVVSLNGKDYTFNGDTWDDRPPYEVLDVFHAGFVSRNVHAATGIDPDHKRNLCELVLGRGAVENVAKLALADTEGRAALAEIKSIERQLESIIKKPDNLMTFLGLSIDPEVDQKLNRARGELKEAQSKAAIIARAVPKEITLPLIGSDAISSLLEKTSDAVGADVSVIVKTHIKEHLDREGEAWLAYGANHLDNNKCPFCLQKTETSGLVTAIREYFSEQYKSYTEELSHEIKQIRERLGTSVFPQIKASVMGQLTVAAQWNDVAPIDQGELASSLNEAEAEWNSAAKKLGTLILSKQEKPLDRIDPSLAIEAYAKYGNALSLLTRINAILSDGAKKAEDWKVALAKANTSEIEEIICRLENKKTRFAPPVRDLLEKRNLLLEKRAKIESDKVALKKEIDEHAAKVVGKYQSGINHYLELFNCDIRIEEVEPRFPGGKASVQYKLKAHGHEIELGVSEVAPCFETVLSDGDKYTFALSFFFARLKDLPSLNGHVVVLDDPVNSLGRSRRSLINGVIRDLRARGAQVIVLTHDERLAALMLREKTLQTAVSLQVERTRTGSKLKPWDVERALQSEYVRHYFALSNYLDSGGDHAGPAACIRPYVEQRIRHLYPGAFETRDSLGSMISKIRSSAPGARLHGLLPKLSALIEINDAALSSHHASGDVPGLDPLTPDGVRIFAEKALNVLD